MRIIAMMNQKGGVGKTTSTINLGAALARLKHRVLLVDLDPQGHLSYSLGVDSSSLETTTYEVLSGGATLREAAVMCEGRIKVVPANLRLSGFEIEYAAHPGREEMLKGALEDVRGRYGYVLLDCPPNLGLITINALVAASEIFIPLQAEFLAMQSFSRLLETVEVVRERFNPDLAIEGIIATRFSKRRKLHREVLHKVREYFGDKLFETHIRENIALAEAPSFGKDIFTYAPNSNGALDYLNLGREVDKRG